MPRPGLRSRSQKRHRVKTPGGRITMHYWRNNPKKAHCAICKTPLMAIPRLRPSKMKKSKNSSRRANRLESGRYCGNCLQDLIKESVRTQQ